MVRTAALRQPWGACIRRVRAGVAITGNIGTGGMGVGAGVGGLMGVVLVIVISGLGEGDGIFGATEEGKGKRKGWMACPGFVFVISLGSCFD